MECHFPHARRPLILILRWDRKSCSGEADNSYTCTGESEFTRPSIVRRDTQWSCESFDPQHDAISNHSRLHYCYPPKTCGTVK